MIDYIIMFGPLMVVAGIALYRPVRDDLRRAVAMRREVVRMNELHKRGR